MTPPDEEDILEEQNFIRRVKKELVENKHCRTCINAIEVPHYEMGYDAGTDPYCTLLKELKYLILQFKNQVEVSTWFYYYTKFVFLCQ